MAFNREVVKALKNLFTEVNMASEFEEAMSEKCSIAYLHGLLDSAREEWADAHHMVQQLCQERRCYPIDLDVDQLESRFPGVIFRDDCEMGFQWARGRLFSLRDYQMGKELLGQIGQDSFAEEFTASCGKNVPINSHLWD